MGATGTNEKITDLSKQQVQWLKIIAFLGAVIGIFSVCLMVLWPFLPSLLLSLILTLATWPAYEWLVKNLKGRRTLSAFFMILGLALLFLAPVVLLGNTIVEGFGNLTNAIKAFLGQDDLVLPVWVQEIPVLGTYAQNTITPYLQDQQRLIELAQQHAGTAADWVLRVAATTARGGIEVTLAIIFCFFTFRHGEAAAKRLGQLFVRFAGEKATHIIDLTKKTLIGVIYGIVGTAFVQGALAMIGFWIAGVPGAPLWGILTFLLSFLPVGPPLIWGGRQYGSSTKGKPGWPFLWLSGV